MAGTTLLRIAALAAAIYGIQSPLVMMLPEKRLAIPALEMCDFTVDAGGYFLRYAGIISLFAVIGHYVAAGLQTLQRQRS